MKRFMNLKALSIALLLILTTAAISFSINGVPVLVQSPNGGFWPKTNLNSAVASADTANKTIYVIGYSPLTGNLTVPSTRAIKIVFGGQIDQGAYTLTVNGPFEAGLHKIFLGTGLVTFGPGSILQFPAVWHGAIPDDSTDSTPAINKSLLSGVPVQLASGVYASYSTIHVQASNQTLQGVGPRESTIINYYGGSVALRMGMGFKETGGYVYNQTLKNFRFSMKSTVHPPTDAILVKGSTHFIIDNVAATGSGDPNATPTPVPLIGYGFHFVDGAIVGTVNHIRADRFDHGIHLDTSPDEPDWTAALVFGGQGGVYNNNYGIVVGNYVDTSITGASVVFRDMDVEGNYQGGVIVNTGYMTTVENNYFESNGNYDVTVGSASGPIIPMTTVIRGNNMSGGDISSNPYGTPGANVHKYNIHVVNGNGTIIENNAMSTPTNIPNVQIEAAADGTQVRGNRLNKGAGAAPFINNLSRLSLIYPNYGAGYTSSTTQSFTRTLGTGTVDVAYTGLGFTPSAIQFVCGIDDTTVSSIGNTDQEGHNKSKATLDTGANYSSSDKAIYLQTSSGNVQMAVLKSYDLDGFTLTYTSTGTLPANNAICTFTAGRAR